MTTTEQLKARLIEMGLSPKRAFGQNFLVNQNVIGRIIAAVTSRPHTHLVEVGPGLGALTNPLLEAELKPRLIEIDRELVAYWRTRNLEVVEGDALRLDWSKLGLAKDSLLVSNTPYNISTSLVVERCLGPVEIQNMVLMFQKEVAERLMARPRTKDYGALSVMAQLHFTMSRVTDASSRDFFPAPKVSSRVLAFERKPDPGLGEPFLKFVKGAFAQRRKFLLKNLRAVVDKSKYDYLALILSKLGHDEKARAEELAPDDFARFFRTLQK